MLWNLEGLYHRVLDRVLGFFSSRSNWDPPPHPLTHRRMCPHFGSRGGAPSLAGEGGGGSQLGRGDRHCGTLQQANASLPWNRRRGMGGGVEHSLANGGGGGGPGGTNSDDWRVSLTLCILWAMDHQRRTFIFYSRGQISTLKFQTDNFSDFKFWNQLAQLWL